MKWDRVVTTSVIWLSTGWMTNVIKNDLLLGILIIGAVLISINLWVEPKKKES